MVGDHGYSTNIYSFEVVLYAENGDGTEVGD
jgi:hypothetical protein